jgi:hypothetical protein
LIPYVIQLFAFILTWIEDNPNNFLIFLRFVFLPFKFPKDYFYPILLYTENAGNSHVFLIVNCDSSSESRKYAGN